MTARRLEVKSLGRRRRASATAACGAPEAGSEAARAARDVACRWGHVGMRREGIREAAPRRVPAWNPPPWRVCVLASVPIFWASGERWRARR
jgi:hypothetical protein